MRAIGSVREVRDWGTCILVKLSWEVIRHALPLVPEATAGQVTAPILHDGGVPVTTLGVVGCTVLAWDAKENVVIDLSRGWANTMRPENVEHCIADLTIDPSS